jgi:pyruvate formate-lyase/glycerol dehydratase family glycyl radical enzyme
MTRQALAPTDGTSSPQPAAARRVNLPSRLAALKEGVMRRKGSRVEAPNPFLGDIALWRAVAPDRSRVQHRAAFLLELVRAAPIEINPGWSLAGEHLRHPEWGFGLARDLKPEVMKRLDEFGLAPEQVDAVRAVVYAWTCRDPKSGAPMAPQHYATGETTDDARLGIGPGWWVKDGTASTMVYMAGGWTENHSIRDFAKAIRVGFGGIRKEVEALLNSADLADPDYPRKENFWRAALSICEAGGLLGRRYAEAAAALAAKADDPAERDRLTRMAEVCARVPEHGARTFFEATQALWFAHILTCGEDGINANSIGRMDQFLFPYYDADLKAGRLTRDRALEIMEELACKLYLEYDVQAITLGGVDAAGRDAVNELSYIILDATANVGLIRDLSIRVHRNSPKPFIRRASELIAEGGGIPFIFNDDCFIPALSQRGIPVEDARDYAPIGCIELTIPGKTNPHAVSGWFNAARCLELALFDGRIPSTGEQLGPRTGMLADHKTFESLYAAYAKQVEFFSKRMVYNCNRGELAQRERGPLPCWSVLTDDCIRRGRDITDGGAQYFYHSICFMGTADVADSLAALDELYFKGRRFSADDLLAALKANFEGHEPLRQMLLKNAPKYGNDMPAVDEIAARICRDFIALMDTMRSPLGGRYYVHLFTFLANIGFGKTVGALPDGRKAGEPLAYSLSAHQGRDVKGVTALLNTLARLPHDQAAGATASIVEIDPGLVAGPAGVERLAQTIETAVAMKVGQLQWNVTTVERLLQAQADPEHYGNIPVRVAGYSQMFKLVDRELQNHIIARTKHRQG